MSFPVLYGSKEDVVTLTLQPDATAGVDTDLNLSSPGSNYGTATDMMAYTTVVGPNVFSTILIKFDLSSIPSGANIRKVTLSLYAFSTMGGAGTVNVYRILAANNSWTEAGATWQHQVGTTNWAGGHNGCNVADTDYDSTVMGSFAVTTGEVTGTVYNISLSIAQFKLMLATNRGMMLFSPLGITPLGMALFCTSDHATAAYHPKLTVVYE